MGEEHVITFFSRTITWVNYKNSPSWIRIIQMLDGYFSYHLQWGRVRLFLFYLRKCTLSGSEAQFSGVLKTTFSEALLFTTQNKKALQTRVLEQRTSETAQFFVFSYLFVAKGRWRSEDIQPYERLASIREIPVGWNRTVTIHSQIYLDLPEHTWTVLISYCTFLLHDGIPVIPYLSSIMGGSIHRKLSFSYPMFVGFCCLPALSFPPSLSKNSLPWPRCCE